jgi:hypothetical protein
VHSGHRIGQDTRQVLASVLHYPEERIAALQAAGVICCDARDATAPMTVSPATSSASPP